MKYVTGCAKLPKPKKNAPTTIRFGWCDRPNKQYRTLIRNISPTAEIYLANKKRYMFSFPDGGLLMKVTVPYKDIHKITEYALAQGARYLSTSYSIVRKNETEEISTFNIGPKIRLV